MFVDRSMIERIIHLLVVFGASHVSKRGDKWTIDLNLHGTGTGLIILSVIVVIIVCAAVHLNQFWVQSSGFSCLVAPLGNQIKVELTCNHWEEKHLSLCFGSYPRPIERGSFKNHRSVWAEENHPPREHANKLLQRHQANCFPTEPDTICNPVRGLCCFGNTIYFSTTRLDISSEVLAGTS